MKYANGKCNYGYTFSRSNTAYVKVLQFLRNMGAFPRKDIVEAVWNADLSQKGRGWNSNVFSALRNAGLVKYEWNRWDITDKGMKLLDSLSSACCSKQLVVEGFKREILPDGYVYDDYIAKNPSWNRRMHASLKFNHPNPSRKYVKILDALDKHGYMHTSELKRMGCGCMIFSAYLERMLENHLVSRYTNGKSRTLWHITAKGKNLLLTAAHPVTQPKTTTIIVKDPSKIKVIDLVKHDEEHNVEEKSIVEEPVEQPSKTPVVFTNGPVEKPIVKPVLTLDEARGILEKVANALGYSLDDFLR